MTTSRPVVPLLDDNDVHIWVTDTCRPIGYADIALLSPDERDRADRFRFDRDRCCFMLTRAVTRRLVAGYLDDVDAAALVFGYGEHGKPYVEWPESRTKLFFNASHSAERAAIAVTRAGDIGVDIERSNRVIEYERLAPRVFSTSELARFEARPRAVRRAVFFIGWTRKEAFIKATGEGMWRSLQSVDVELDPRAPVRLLAVDGSADEAARWTLADFDPAPGYVGAVAVRARGVRVRRMDWPGPLT